MDGRNSKKNARDLETLNEFMHFITMGVYFGSLGP